MDLRSLQSFLAVAEEGSISAAARRLHTSQPPLSVRIQGLERELGVELLSRHGRGVALTDAGRLLVERARRLLLDLDGAATAVRTVGQGVSGRLSLAVGPTIAPALIASLLGQMRDQAPGVALTISDQASDAVLDRVRHGDADTGLVHLPPPTASRAGHDPATDGILELAVIAREPLVVVLPRGHAQAGAERVDLAGLTGEALIVPARGAVPGLHEHVVSAWRSVDGDGGRIREADSTTTLLALVESGAGVAILPATLAQIAWDGLLAVPLRQPRPVAETAIAWRRATTSPVVRRFLRLALATPEPDVLGPERARPDHETVGTTRGDWPVSPTHRP